jgi:hypothetical protein
MILVVCQSYSLTDDHVLKWSRRPAGPTGAGQVGSGTMLMAPQGHSLAHMPQPLQ